MKRFLSLLLCTILILPVICVPASAVGSIYDPGDVPKVFITTSSSVSLEYSNCKIQIIDAAGGSVPELIDNGAVFKIRGNSTSSGAKKPYNIKFSSKTSVLGMGKNKKWCLLANCYDKSLIRNQMVLDFADTIGLAYTPQYRVVEVYLNGAFQGTYLLTDAIKASSSRVDIDIEGHEFILERDARTDEGTTYFTTSRYGIRLGINEPEEQTSEQYSWLMNFLREAENALASGDYDKVREYFDIESMIDFYIVLEYFKNVDVDTGSTRFYIKGDKIYGGPCWDFDLSSGNCDYNYYWTYNNANTTGDSTQGLWCNKLWFRPLLTYPEFFSALKQRYLELQDNIVNLYADDRLGKNQIDAIQDEYGEVFKRNYREAGWSISAKYSELERFPSGSYSQELSYLRSWLKKRNQWLLEFYDLKSELELKKGSTYKIRNYFIDGVTENTSYASILEQFDDETAYGVTASGRLVSPMELAVNGSYITIGGASYTVLIRGDAIADGAINVADYVFIKRYVLHSVDTDDAMRKLASDVNGNGTVDATDYAIVKRHVLGTFTMA